MNDIYRFGGSIDMIQKPNIGLYLQYTIWYLTNRYEILSFA